MVHFETAVRLFADRLGPDSPESLDTTVDLAEAQRRAARIEEARRTLERVAEICQTDGPALGATLERAYFGLSMVWKDLGDAAKASRFERLAEDLEARSRRGEPIPPEK